MLEPVSVPFGKQYIECQFISKGTKNMVCFNGYGKLAADFRVFEPCLQGKYTALGVNLPFHGNSNWTVRKENLDNFLQTILSQFEVKPVKITILAYSIGARYAYLLQKNYPELIERIVFLAPDGIVSNPTSQFTTFNPLGMKLMNWFIEHPGLIIGTIKAIRKMRLLTEGDFAFYMRKIRTREDRKMLQKVWNEVYSHTPTFEELIKQGSFKSTKIDFLLGKQDMVFPEKKLRARITPSPLIKVHVCDSGHNMLNKIVRKALDQIL